MNDNKCFYCGHPVEARLNPLRVCEVVPGKGTYLMSPAHAECVEKVRNHPDIMYPLWRYYTGFDTVWHMEYLYHKRELDLREERASAAARARARRQKRETQTRGGTRSAPQAAGDLCNILASHHEILKDDPDRLSTDFLKSLIGGSAKRCNEP